mmetsp:Transcript_27698/g.55452  ORF Transcript_27698/g.55452 Transcript_27698/m.55452 type:complete len:200 (+) Transcript_27698:24-623(+)
MYILHILDWTWIWDRDTRQGHPQQCPPVPAGVLGAVPPTLPGVTARTAARTIPLPRAATGPYCDAPVVRCGRAPTSITPPSNFSSRPSRLRTTTPPSTAAAEAGGTAGETPSGRCWSVPKRSISCGTTGTERAPRTTIPTGATGWGPPGARRGPTRRPPTARDGARGPRGATSRPRDGTTATTAPAARRAARTPASAGS